MRLPWPSFVECCALLGMDSSWTGTEESPWSMVNQWLAWHEHTCKKVTFLTWQLLLSKEKQSRRQTFAPPACHCSSLACSASSSLCVPQYLCSSYSISLSRCKSSTVPSSMGEMQHSSALRECALGYFKNVDGITKNTKQKPCKPFAFQLSCMPLWEAVWSGYVSISSNLLATVPLLHFGRRATSWGSILRKQNVWDTKVDVELINVALYTWPHQVYLDRVLICYRWTLLCSSSLCWCLSIPSTCSSTAGELQMTGQTKCLPMLLKTSSWPVTICNIPLEEGYI